MSRVADDAPPAGLTEDELETWPVADNLHAATCRELLRRVAFERTRAIEAERRLLAAQKTLDHLDPCECSRCVRRRELAEQRRRRWARSIRER